MVNIVLFGAPGAGKGTQAQRLAAELRFNHISTGDVIRREIADATALGLSVKDAIARGELAPDEVVIEIIDNFMMTHGRLAGNIFDGFPRTIPQARRFDEILATHSMRVDAMIELVVPEAELVKRILLRALDSGRADDADERVIRNRIEVYRAQTAPVADFYRSQDKYFALEGSRPIDETYAALLAEIRALRKNS